MATRRMLHNKISLSEQVNNLSIEAALLFTWMITHADDDGRLKGETAYIKAKVFPMKEYKISEIDSMLQEIVSQGLINRWSDQQGTYIEFPTWLDHQTLQNDRYKPSPIPSYSEYVSKMETDRLQNDSILESQHNIDKSNITKIKQKRGEDRGLRGKMISDKIDPASYIPKTQSEQSAKNLWAILDSDKPELFESRYLKIAKHDIPSDVLYQTSREIMHDESVLDKGRAFEEEIIHYIGRLGSKKL